MVGTARPGHWSTSCTPTRSVSMLGAPRDRNELSTGEGGSWVGAVLDGSRHLPWKACGALWDTTSGTQSEGLCVERKSAEAQGAFLGVHPVIPQFSQELKASQCHHFHSWVPPVSIFNILQYSFLTVVVAKPQNPAQINHQRCTHDSVGCHLGRSGDQSPYAALEALGAHLSGAWLFP